MSKWLVKTVETYRVDNEAEAAAFIEEQKQQPEFELEKYVNSKKEVKSKGEIVDSWRHVELTKLFNEEKEPDTFIHINYGVN